MNPVLVGSYPIDGIDVSVYLREGLGAEFRLRDPNHTNKSTIFIGSSYDSSEWFVVLNCLLHEVIEFQMMNRRFRYAQTGSWENHNNYLFIFNHVDFSDMILDSSHMIAKAIKDLEKAWRKILKERSVKCQNQNDQEEESQTKQSNG